MLKIKLLFFVALSCLVSTSAAQDDFKYKTKIDELVKPFVENKKFVGCSIGVIADGKTWFGNYGHLSEAEGKQPNNDTLYEIGSVSKVFTSLMLADAIESGDLKLTTLVSDLLPELKETEFGQKVTLQNLATHTSRLPTAPTNFAPKDPNNPFADYTKAQLIEFIKGSELRDGIGKKYEYSNLAVGLLGDLVASKADMTYEDYLQSRILKSLDMTDTGLELSTEQESRFAPPHNSALIADHPWTFDVVAGAGGIRSSTKDMVKFMRSNLNPPEGDVGKAIDLAWERQDASDKSRPAMGLGWHIAGDGSTRWHNGQTGGYHSMLLVSRKYDAAVILLCNTAGMETDGLAQSIFQAVVGGDPKPQTFAKEVKVDEETVKRLVGTYELYPNVELEVVAKHDRLAVKLTGQSFLKIVPESETVWNLVDVKAQLHFDLPKKGSATKVTLHQNGNKQVGKRIKD